MNLKKLATSYLNAGCPDRRGVKRSAEQCAQEARRIQNLLPHFRVPLTKLSVRHCAEFGAANSHRQRSADLDLQVLSNICWFGVMEGVLVTNPVVGRARNRRSRDVRHCRESMPKNADELHAVARHLLEGDQSQSTGWQMLFEAYTGMRTNEVLELRVDAKDRKSPGWIEGNYLYIRRSKGGGFPYVTMTPELRALAAAHRVWHDERWPECPYFFPGQLGVTALERTVLTRRLSVVCPRLGVGKITSHGLRAYFVTVMRSRGMSNEQVAALIGDRTASLIETTYGALPEVWAGGDPMGFTPERSLPAWEKLPEMKLVLVDGKGVAV